MTDLLHSCVPVAHADAMLLDRKTKQLLEDLNTRAKVFHEREVEDALLHLEGQYP